MLGTASNSANVVGQGFRNEVDLGLVRCTLLQNGYDESIEQFNLDTSRSGRREEEEYNMPHWMGEGGIPVWVVSHQLQVHFLLLTTFDIYKQ